MHMIDNLTCMQYISHCGIQFINITKTCLMATKLLHVSCIIVFRVCETFICQAFLATKNNCPSQDIQNMLRHCQMYSWMLRFSQGIFNRRKLHISQEKQQQKCAYISVSLFIVYALLIASHSDYFLKQWIVTFYLE